MTAPPPSQVAATQEWEPYSSLWASLWSWKYSASGCRWMGTSAGFRQSELYSWKRKPLRTSGRRHRLLLLSGSDGLHFYIFFGSSLAWTNLLSPVTSVQLC